MLHLDGKGRTNIAFRFPREPELLFLFFFLSEVGEAPYIGGRGPSATERVEIATQAL